MNQCPNQYHKGTVTLDILPFYSCMTTSLSGIGFRNIHLTHSAHPSTDQRFIIIIAITIIMYLTKKVIYMQLQNWYGPTI